jgi:putative endonuclease
MNLGQQGEELVAKYYIGNGYKIIGRNVKIFGVKQFGEIDVIALKGNALVFIEVKTRRSTTYGTPAESVNYFKQRKLIKTVKVYLQQHPQFQDFDWRIDVAEVDIDNPVNPVIILTNVIEDLD